MKARDIMRRRVVTAQPQMTLRELAAVFDDHHISGAPVVTARKELVGVVSQTDLVRHDREAPPPVVPPFHQFQDDELRAGGLHAENPDYTRVRDVMTPWVISFEEETLVEEIARQMLAKRIHRVIITRDGKLSGIVSSMDVMRGLLAILEARRTH